MDIKTTILICVIALLIRQSVFAIPFESISTTNGLSYFRTREYHHGGFAFENSVLGMNTFSVWTVSDEDIKETVYGVVRFLKYIYPRRIANALVRNPKEHWTPNGFLFMNSDVDFPARPNREIKFEGHSLKTLRAILFAFRVKNRLSDDVLDMILLKVYFKEQFQGAFYYNYNTSSVSFSFIEASGSSCLVGQESITPYLNADEQLVQKKLLRKIWKKTFSPPRVIPPISHDQNILTNDIDVVSEF